MGQNIYTNLYKAPNSGPKAVPVPELCFNIAKSTLLTVFDEAAAILNINPTSKAVLEHVRTPMTYCYAEESSPERYKLHEVLWSRGEDGIETEDIKLDEVSKDEAVTWLRQKEEGYQQAGLSKVQQSLDKYLHFVENVVNPDYYGQGPINGNTTAPAIKETRTP